MNARTTIDRALLRKRLAPLTAAWERQARRIDGLSLRERAILFLCLVAVLAAVFETLVVSPLGERARQRQQAEARLATEVNALREQFMTESRDRGDANHPLKTQLEAARSERARLDDAFRHAGTLSEGEGLSAVLQRLLARQPGLVLERLKLLEDVPVELPGTAASSPATTPPSSAAAPAFAGMSWQGVELYVQGSYADTQRYLQALERELPGLRWGDLRLVGGDGSEPPRLQVQLFLLKVQP
jgi:MSHA biogenesis protein MshJ